jgi:hypothetical protein
VIEDAFICAAANNAKAATIPHFIAVSFKCSSFCWLSTSVLLPRPQRNNRTFFCLWCG